MNSVIIEEDLYKSEQSIYFRRVVDINGRKVSIKVERNAYDHQSSAIAHLWTGEEWKFLWSLPRTEMTVLARKPGHHSRQMIPVVSYLADKLGQYRDLFEEDARRLEVKASMILL